VNAALAVVIAWLVLNLWVGLRAADDGPVDAEAFVAGDRGMGLVVMYFLTGATVFSAFAFLGGPGWAYSRGVAALYILGYGALGFAPMWFLGPRIARLGRAHGFVTQAELVGARFGSRALPGLMALVSLVAFVPYLALQMKGAGYVLETVSDGAVPAWLGAGVSYAVVLAYVLRSGVLGVGWTNTLQGVLMMVLAWALGLYLPYELYGGIGPMFERIAAERPELLTAPGLAKDGSPWSWSEYTSAIWVSVLGFCAWPHLFMKAYNAESDRTLRRTVVLYPTFQIFLVPLFLIGFAGVFFESAPASSDQILPHMLMHMDLPAAVVGLFCAGAMAASMSSGDAMAHAAASIAVRDGLVGGLGWRLDGADEVRAIRVALVGVMVAAYGVAVAYTGSLVALLLSAYGAIVQFAPGLLATLCLRRTNGTAIGAGMAAGTVVTTALVLDPSLRPWAVHPGLYGFVINALLVVALSAVLPADGDEGFVEG
jgi:SSS family solute:Na+ symporter